MVPYIWESGALDLYIWLGRRPRGVGVPRTKRFARPRLVAVIFEEEEYEAARRAAAARGMTFSEWLRSLVKRELLSGGAAPTRPQREPQQVDPQPEGRERGGRSRLDGLEDCALIRDVRNPKGLARACERRGLLLYDLGEVGARGVVVFTETWALYAAYAASEDGMGPSEVEALAARALQSGGAQLSEREKVALALFALSRMGRVAWDGSKWVEVGGSGETRAETEEEGEAAAPT
jgi:hypothetical protein